MSNEIHDLPEDEELAAADLDQVAGGAISASSPGTLSAGSLGGAAQVGGAVNRTKIEFTGEEVDSQ
jgi:hypothetical protein